MADLNAAHWTFDYLLKEANRQYRAYASSLEGQISLSLRSRMVVKRSFVLGFCWAINTKVEEIVSNRESKRETCMDLVLCKDKAIKEKFGDFEYRKKHVQKSDRHGFGEGARAGRETNISMPIEQ